jgi:hypothetical protein
MAAGQFSNDTTEARESGATFHRASAWQGDRYLPIKSPPLFALPVLD